MSDTSANLITAKGLVTFSNELSVPQGSLVNALNVNIDEQGVITPRRGNNDYGAEFGTSSDRLKQIAEYKNRVFRHYGSTLEFDDGTGNFIAFTGNFNEIEEGFRIKYQELNGNFYFTTDGGIKKISVVNSAGITANSVNDAGAVKAYDINATPVTSATGFMPTESKVAYRVVFGTTDVNGNLLLGSPSARFVVTNTSGVDQANADVEITLPSDLTTEYFYQLYRTAPIQISGSLTLADIDPGDEMNLVIENPITSSDLSTGTITVSDVTPDDFRENGTFLYTNEITGQGINQSNEPPPIAKDVEIFRNSMFYANTKTVHQLQITLLSAANFTAGTSELIVGGSSNVRRYVFDNTEDIPNQQVEISSSSSIAQAIDETARSLVKVINRDSSSPVYARYTSGASDLPGIIVLEARDLTDTEFYVATNDSAIVTSFNPQLPEIETLSSVEISGVDSLITAAGHGLSTGQEVYVNSPNTTPTINGKFEVTVLNANEFTIPTTITGEDLVGTDAFFFVSNDNIESDNQEFPNRIYFSKTSQPEAVPAVNFIDVGPKDQPIERILALRDNLFVMKTDGIYIVDGVTAPDFSVRLLESTTTIIAPDSAVVLGNLIYCLTTQGVTTITETGVSVISRVIEDRILGITNNTFDFRLKAFGVAYETARAYHLWLPTNVEDEVATQCYRYNYFERAWSRWDVPATCGLVTLLEDKLYLGDGSRNYLLQERKNLDRTDYSDRNFSLSIGSNDVNGVNIEISSVTDVAVGDVLVQEQYVTIAIFNRLLRKLDIDPGLDDEDYESTLAIVAGANITNSMQSLNDKLVTDDASGTITAKVISSDWETLRTQYNTLIDELNNAASDPNFNNYKKEESDTYVYEAVITSRNNLNNVVTVNYAPAFLEGGVELYKGYEKKIQWAPQHFGNPSQLKQVRESTIMFDQNNFYGAKVAYSSDISAGFVEVPFLGRGVGFWGSAVWGQKTPEYYYWGGDGNDVPFRTVVPRQKQRGRYLNMRFEHENAREFFRIVGISAVVRPLSTRAYR